MDDGEVVEVEVVVVGKAQSDPLSVVVTEPVRPSEPFHAVVTVTGPGGRGVEKASVEPTHVSVCTLPLTVTVAELVPVEGNAE